MRLFFNNNTKCITTENYDFEIISTNLVGNNPTEYNYELVATSKYYQTKTHSIAHYSNETFLQSILRYIIESESTSNFLYIEEAIEIAERIELNKDKPLKA